LYYLATEAFPYSMVSIGKLPFTYEELKAIMGNKKFLLIVITIIFNLVVFQQVAEGIRWFNRHKDHACRIIGGGIMYLAMLVFGYGLLIA